MMTKQIENTLTSMEVAEMVEKTHGKLLRDIRIYEEQLNQRKIEPVTFFAESTYKDSKGETRPCYNVTKKGCEFIAHKMTGAKGTVFTARYINRFHEMEDVIREKVDSTTPRPFLAQTPLPLLDKGSLPLVSDWYDKNKWRIRKICREYEVTYTELYHSILKRCAEKYDMRAANRIYSEETGEYPMYAMDVVNYFSELRDVADRFLDSIE